MKTESILVTYGTSCGSSSWHLDGVKFIYCGNTWVIEIKSHHYQVSELVASQVAYALTVCADIDIIQESLEDDEIFNPSFNEEKDEKQEKLSQLSFEEWKEQEFRKSIVRNLVENITQDYTYGNVT